MEVRHRIWGFGSKHFQTTKTVSIFWLETCSKTNIYLISSWNTWISDMFWNGAHLLLGGSSHLESDWQVGLFALYIRETPNWWTWQTVLFWFTKWDDTPTNSTRPSPHASWNEMHHGATWSCLLGHETIFVVFLGCLKAIRVGINHCNPFANHCYPLSSVI